MKQFRTVAVPGGHVCAYVRPDGSLCAVSDHPSKASAQGEAARLNAAELIKHQRGAVRAICAQAVRQPVRYFEPDAYA